MNKNIHEKLLVALLLRLKPDKNKIQIIYASRKQNDKILEKNDHHICIRCMFETKKKSRNKSKKTQFYDGFVQINER